MDVFAGMILDAAAQDSFKRSTEALERELEATRARNEAIEAERARLAAVSESRYAMTEVLMALGGGPRVGLPLLPPHWGRTTDQIIRDIQSRSNP